MAVKSISVKVFIVASVITILLFLRPSVPVSAKSNFLAILWLQSELGKSSHHNNQQLSLLAAHITQSLPILDARLPQTISRLLEDGRCCLILDVRTVTLMAELPSSLIASTQAYNIQNGHTGLWLGEELDRDTECQYRVTPIAEQMIVPSLVRNGNFEWFIENGESSVFSYFARIYSHTPYHFQSRFAQRAGRETAVAVLSGDGPIPLGSGANSGLISQPMPVVADDYYLFGGWVRTGAGAHSAISVSWHAQGRGGIDLYLHPPISAPLYCTEDGWQFFVGLLQAPLEARYARLWLANVNGQSEFAEVFLIPVITPSSSLP